MSSGGKSTLLSINAQNSQASEGGEEQNDKTVNKPKNLQNTKKVSTSAQKSPKEVDGQS
jgi:ABC-type cobalamin/Fe3+-siderophores transport system ATPase subunit